MDDLFQALRSYIPLIPEGMEVRGQRTAAPDAEELRWRVDLDLRVSDPDALSPDWRRWYEGILFPTEPHVDTGSMDFVQSDRDVRTIVTVSASRPYVGTAWRITIDGRPRDVSVPHGLYREGYRQQVSWWNQGDWFARDQGVVDTIVLICDEQGIDYTITEIARS
jgi:hypothetical protein